MAIDRATALRTAETLLRQGKLDRAIAEYLRVVDDQPRDWNTANLLGDLYVRAGEIDKAVAQFNRIAVGFHQDGFLSKAGALYKKILKVKPGDEQALLQAAEISAAQGLLVDARVHLHAAMTQCSARGDQRGAASIAIRLAALDPSDFDARHAGAQARAALGDLPGAVRALKDLASELALAGRQMPALDVLQEAAQLEPGDAESSPRALTSFAGHPHLPAADAQHPGAVKSESPTTHEAQGETLAAAVHVSKAPSTPIDADVQGLAPLMSPPLAQVKHQSEDIEVDLSVMLDEMQRMPMAPGESVEIAGVFAHLRDDAARRLEIDGGEQAFKTGMTLYQAGLLDDSIDALEVAARTPHCAFEAAFMLGRIHLGRGQLAKAIEWLEHGAAAPSPSPAARHALLYELVEALESAGDVTRAFARSLELQAETNEFRDVNTRVNRLARAQARG